MAVNAEGNFLSSDSGKKKKKNVLTVDKTTITRALPSLWKPLFRSSSSQPLPTTDKTCQVCAFVIKEQPVRVRRLLPVFASQPQSTTSFGNNIAIATSCALRRSCTFSLLSLLTSRVSCDDAFGGGNASGGNWDRSASRVRSVSLWERGRPNGGFAWPLTRSRIRTQNRHHTRRVTAKVPTIIPSMCVQTKKTIPIKHGVS